METEIRRACVPAGMDDSQCQNSIFFGRYSNPSNSGRISGRMWLTAKIKLNMKHLLATDRLKHHISGSRVYIGFTCSWRVEKVLLIALVKDPLKTNVPKTP